MNACAVSDWRRRSRAVPPSDGQGTHQSRSTNDRFREHPLGGRAAQTGRERPADSGESGSAFPHFVPESGLVAPGQKLSSVRSDEQVAQADRHLSLVEDIIRIRGLPVTEQKILVRQHEWPHARLISSEGPRVVAAAARQFAAQHEGADEGEAGALSRER